jgi:cytoskeletal protein CcmA (bactofilin family)
MAATKEFGATGAEPTVIGPSILISGKLSGDEDLTVRGRVEGELSLTRTLIVEPSGIVKANVSVRNAIISGVVVGNITASESVELTRDGRMVGDIRSPRVIIVDGASFRGHVDMGNAEPRAAGERPATQRPTLARPVVRPATPAPARPALVASTRPATGTATAVARPAAPAVSSGKPVPPPAPALQTKVERNVSKPVPPPPPPQPVLVGEAGKKKVLVKKKK